MNPDELEPQPKPAKPRDLEAMSVEALKDYIAQLDAEIVRARSVIGSKQAARSAADGVFRR